jgi:histidine triad (HIT) family protein
MIMHEDSIFTKIVKGEIPCHKIYEDELTLAFLDIHPVQPGHVLVITKEQIEFVWDLPDGLYQALMATTKKVALQLRKTLDKPFIHQRIVGTDVPHAHIHLIPFATANELKNEPDMSVEVDHAALSELAQRIAF